MHKGAQPRELHPLCAHHAVIWPSKLCRLHTWQARTRVVGKVKAGFGPQPRIGPLLVFTPRRASSGSRDLQGARPERSQGRGEGAAPPPHQTPPLRTPCPSHLCKAGSPTVSSFGRRGSPAPSGQNML